MSLLSIRTNKSKGIIQSYQSGFSTAYRLVDLVLISLLYFSLLYLQQLDINSRSLIPLFVCIVGYMVSAEALDLYRSWRTSSTILMIRMTAVAWLLTGLVTLSCAYFFAHLIPYPNRFILTWLLGLFPVLTGWRLLFRRLLRAYRKNGHNTRTAIVIGSNKLAYSLARQLEDNEHLGIRFAGFFDDRDEQRLPYELREQTLGSIEEAIEKARANEVDYIYIAMPMSAEQRITDILQQCSDTTANVYIIPNFFIYNLLNSRWQTIGSLQILSIFDTPFEGPNHILKRMEDILLSSLILTLIALPMLVIAAAVKLTSPGPVIFKQTRYGLGGRPIIVYKFRSMTTQDNGNQVRQATRNDARITPLGAFLRRTSLDELPQFINVLQGRMSIVGPRPHAVAHNEEYRKLIEGYMLRHKVLPGITGWAQINGFRGETETVNKMMKRVEYDLDYIHSWSVWLDIRIILMTLFKGFTDRNAY
ncbi:undecaprenyl-phosphate glucose phosphotransferase [Bowmanella dokdonensis]|uniref:Undecaprenyl-phosphate glucose phosphotransferase n=1 Tax=Bowmanella dokdonensis TaxID=751969 RepID=A0A939DL37_9ALTE|nr:undecaprenyl-phosphate glucose phosphotransferase [Bowmanella dokdonensis]MBN7824704.1 undecaprenyl-phosphate glucose phosphotransferase [Bowmanella dokdonensis]